jgi:hypothetical protein
MAYVLCTIYSIVYFRLLKKLLDSGERLFRKKNRQAEIDYKTDNG